MELYKQRDSAEREVSINDGTAERQLDKFDSMKATQLKALCKEYGLKVAGNKADLQEHLRGHLLSVGQDQNDSEQDDFESMTVAELKGVCATRGLPTSGAGSYMTRCFFCTGASLCLRRRVN